MEKEFKLHEVFECHPFRVDGVLRYYEDGVTPPKDAEVKKAGSMVLVGLVTFFGDSYTQFMLMDTETPIPDPTVGGLGYHESRVVRKPIQRPAAVLRHITGFHEKSSVGVKKTVTAEPKPKAKLGRKKKVQS